MTTKTMTEEHVSDWDPDPSATTERVDVREHRALRAYLNDMGRAAARRVMTPADYARAVEEGQQARRQRVKRNRRARRRGL